MVIKSAGIVMVRIKKMCNLDGTSSNVPLYLCVKPGGPWKNMDWSIPKGGKEKDDISLKNAGIREFGEETGQIAPEEELISVGSIRQRKGKVVYAWYFIDNNTGPIKFRSNSYSIEHPKNSGKMKSYKEVINHKFLTENEAYELLISPQYEFILRIKKDLEARGLL